MNDSEFKKGDLVKVTIYSQNGQQYHRSPTLGSYGSDNYLGILVTRIDNFLFRYKHHEFYDVYLFKTNEILYFRSDEIRKLSK